MKILIGVDFYDASVDAGRWAARWFGPAATLAPTYVVRIPDVPSFTRVLDEGHGEILDHARSEAARALEPIVDEFGADRSEAIVTTGSPGEALLTAAREWGADVIAVGPHGAGSPSAGFFGGTASYLLRHSDIPVLVVRGGMARPPRRVMVAMTEGAATEGLLSMTRTIADDHGSVAVGVYVIETLIDGLPTFSATTGPEREAELDELTRSWLRARLEGAGFDGEHREAIAARGKPGSTLCALAETEHADLIVMGTHGHPLAGPALGSVARYVVSHAPRPVLVVPQK